MISVLACLGNGILYCLGLTGGPTLGGPIYSTGGMALATLTEFSV